MNAIKIPVLHRRWTRSEIINAFKPFIDVYRIDFWQCEGKPDYKMAILSFTGNFWKGRHYINFDVNNEQWLCVPFFNEIPCYTEPLVFLTDFLTTLNAHIDKTTMKFYKDVYDELYEGNNNELCMINKHQLAYFMRKRINMICYTNVDNHVIDVLSDSII
jgi:hypothetical protein